MVDAALLLLTFLLGALLSRVSLCTVAAAQQAVGSRDLGGLARLAIAASASGVVLLACAALAPDMMRLPPDLPLGWGIVLGGLALGLGALLNGGCYLGTVLYLGTGNLNFLFTLVGIGLSLHAAAAWLPLPPASGPGLRMAMGTAWFAGLGLFALVILAVFYARRARGLWVALSAGVLAGFVFARQPGWSYGTVLAALIRAGAHPPALRSTAAALVLFGGAIGGAVLSGRFRVQAPAAVRALRCLVGGAIMGFGAALVPGGNDNLLLWAIPGLAAYGFLAYGMMLASILAAFALAACWPRTARARAQ